MMWKSYFRIQKFFSSFLNVPIVFDTETESFQVTPCNTLWRKIKRFLLTNLCLFAIWGVSIYRLLQQLLSSVRDENFTIVDIVISSIALAFCTEGLAHIWTFHFSAIDICYILTELLKLTKTYSYIPFAVLQGSRLMSVTTDKSIFSKLQLPQYLTGFGLVLQQPMDFSLKSLMQWENHVQSLRNTFTSSRFHMSREEMIMNGIAIGFNGVPLVCFLTPLMTSADPMSYFMRNVVFPKSPTVAMIAASFVQGFTAFHASLLSLNLILICLTFVCEITAVFSSSYPTGKLKRNFANGGGGNNTNRNSESKAAARVSPKGKLTGNWKSSEECDGMNESGSMPQIRIDNYDKRDVVPTTTKLPSSSQKSETGEQENEKVDRGRREQVFLQSLKDQDESQAEKMGKLEKSVAVASLVLSIPQQELSRNSVDVDRDDDDDGDENTSENFDLRSTCLFQVLSPKLDNQLELTSSPFYIPTKSEQSNVESSFSSGKGETSNSNNASGVASPRTTSSSMLMMKIIEELGPAVVVKPPSSSSSSSTTASVASSSPFPIVKKLMGRIPSSLVRTQQRIGSSVEVLFIKSFKLYLQTKLLLIFINSALFYYFPVVIAVGMVLSTLSAYATVKLHSILPLPIRLALLLVGVTIAAVMWMVMTESTEITRHSDEFLRYWKRRIKRSYFRKQLRTCQRLCFKMGPFVDFKMDTVFGVFSTIQTYTVNFAVIKLI